MQQRSKLIMEKAESAWYNKTRTNRYNHGKLQRYKDFYNQVKELAKMCYTKGSIVEMIALYRYRTLDVVISS